MGQETVTNEYATFWTENNEILFGKINSCSSYKKLDYKMAEVYIASIKKLTNGDPMPFVLDLRGVKGSFSIDAAQFISKSLKGLSLITFEAYVVNSLSINLLILSYKRIYDTITPYAMFEDIYEAKEYCLEKIKSNAPI